VVRAALPEETPAILDMVGKSFSPLYEVETGLLSATWGQDGFPAECRRVAVKDGRVVSFLHLVPRWLRFGPAVLRAACVGSLCTDPRFRCQGYAAALMDDACRCLCERGYRLAYMTGIPKFYARWGFHPAMADYRFTIPLSGAEYQPGHGRLREMNAQDAARGARLYAAHSRRRILAALRPPATWRWLQSHARLLQWSFPNPHSLLDSRGRWIGYATWKDEGATLTAYEVVVRPRESCLIAALDTLLEEVHRRRKAVLALRLPPDDPLAVCASRRVPGAFEMRTHPDGGELAWVIDLAAALQDMTPLLEQRAAQSEFSRWSGGFVLKSGRQQAAVRLSHGRVMVSAAADGPVVRVASRCLPAVLTGFLDISCMAWSLDVHIPADLRRLLAVLFPRGYPFIYWGDCF
jgi:predicted N-acetyltransferase YhbS